jgi:hypothetical protein
MHSPDKRNFDQLMDTLGETFGKPVTDLMKQTYWVALKDQPWEVVEICAKSHSRYGKFFPKPAELRPKDEKRLHQDTAGLDASEKFITDTWEQLRQRDPEQYWIAFKAAYLGRLPFRFPANSLQYGEAYKRCVDRCDAELRNLTANRSVAAAQADEDFF